METPRASSAQSTPHPDPRRIEVCKCLFAAPSRGLADVARPCRRLWALSYLLLRLSRSRPTDRRLALEHHQHLELLHATLLTSQ